MINMADNRYQRQAELIEGWDQDKLSYAKIAIVGADTLLGQYLTISLSSLGVGEKDQGIRQGRILAMGNTRNEKGEKLLDIEKEEGMSRVESLEEVIEKINPNINLFPMHACLAYDVNSALLGKENQIIVDATGDPSSQLVSLKYSQMMDIPAIIAGCSEVRGTMLIKYQGQEISPKQIIEDFRGKPQGDLIAMVISGLITEEVRKLVMPLSWDEKIKGRVHYNLMSDTRFDSKQDRDIGLAGELKDKKVLMVGAGALGNFVGLGLAKMGVKEMHIVDPDDVEETNLNRQVLYYDSIGEHKAEILAWKLNQINKNVKAIPIIDAISEETPFMNNKYDMYLDCVDNFAARAVLNDFATRYGVPLVSGGTSYKAGQVVVYKPDETLCLDCQLGIKELAKESEQRQGESCIYAPNPSVIMTNQVIGAMMAAEALSVFYPEKFGNPINGKIMYKPDQAERLGFVGTTGACTCHKKGKIRKIR